MRKFKQGHYYLCKGNRIIYVFCVFTEEVYSLCIDLSVEQKYNQTISNDYLNANIIKDLGTNKDAIGLLYGNR